MQPAPRPATNGDAVVKQATAVPMTAAERGRLRREGLRARRQQESRNRRLTAVGIAAVIVAVLAGILLYRNYQDSIKPGERFADQGNTHIDEGQTYSEYNSNPPTSGPHYNRLAEWGVHDEPVPLGLQIHNLEDGGVVIQYKDIPADALDKLKVIAGRYPEHVVLAPKPDIPAPIALTAWTRLLLMNDYDEAKVVEFIEAYKGIDHHVPGQG
jgi:hypothetical protein